MLRLWFVFLKSSSMSVRVVSKYVFSLFISCSMRQHPQDAWSTVQAEHKDTLINRFHAQSVFRFPHHCWNPDQPGQVHPSYTGHQQRHTAGTAAQQLGSNAEWTLRLQICRGWTLFWSLTSHVGAKYQLKRNGEVWSTAQLRKTKYWFIVFPPFCLWVLFLLFWSCSTF